MTRNANGVFSIKVSICMYTSCSISSTILALCPLGLIIQKSAIWRLAKSEKPQIDAKDEINIIFQKRQLLKILLCCGIFFNVDFTQLREYIHILYCTIYVLLSTQCAAYTHSSDDILDKSICCLLVIN